MSKFQAQSFFPYIYTGQYDGRSTSTVSTTTKICLSLQDLPLQEGGGGGSSTFPHTVKLHYLRFISELLLDTLQHASHLLGREASIGQQDVAKVLLRDRFAVFRVAVKLNIPQETARDQNKPCKNSLRKEKGCYKFTSTPLQHHPLCST